MRILLIVLSLLFLPLTAVRAEVSVAIGVPSIRIGINVPAYPRLVRVPGYPVYYDPRADSNYFFYDGAYWVLIGDDWYMSDWYDGPWVRVEPAYVPLFILRIPVRYYRRPPPYFHGWRADAPPHWGEHWGHDWERHRSGWNRWDRRSAPPPAPLPSYQRQYSGDRYPRAQERQQSIRSERYPYQPSEPVIREHYRGQGQQGGGRKSRHDERGRDGR